MLNQPLHRFAIATTLTFPLIFSTLPLTTQSAFAKDRDRSLSIENNSGDDIVRVELRRADSDDNEWHFFRQLIEDGEKASFLVPGGRCPVYYDIQVQLGNGQTLQDVDVNICEERVYNVGSRESWGNTNRKGSDSNRDSNRDFNRDSGSNADRLVEPERPPAAVLPSMFDNLNPSQPLPPNVAAGISVAMSGQGLAPAACSTNPVVMITVNSRYTACAYPTATYAPGRYQMTLQGL